ncbi:hypothetical protein FACS1894130_05100 [Spirochaetia bacterium]|nr:hypothetical protein FACS1894130_05100 [Spirochaetia bacterium]
MSTMPYDYSLDTGEKPNPVERLMQDQRMPRKVAETFVENPGKVIDAFDSLIEKMERVTKE